MPMRKEKPRRLSAWLGALLMLPFAMIQVQQAQAQSCYVSGAFGMNFGAVTSNGRTAISSVSYTCAPDYSGRNRTFYYQACIYIGPGDWSAGQPTRRMSNYNGDYLNYDLFSDPAQSLLIGEPGSTPVYQVLTAVQPGVQQVTQATVHGWVYPNQTVPAFAHFQEQGLQGLVRYRFSSSAFPQSEDCSSGGDGGGNASFSSSGVLAFFENSCRVAATDMNFGLINPPQNAVHETSSIRIQCMPNTPWRVGLDNGLHFDGSTRRMAGADGFVKYQLYLDEGRTKIWGNAGTNMAGGVTDGSGNIPSLTVYGKVPPQPDLKSGSYSDTIIITVYY